MKSFTLLLTLFLSITLFAQVPEKAEDISPLLVGESIPNVNLIDVNGAEVSFFKIIKEKPTVLVFYRGSWCPYCNRQLSALGESEQEIIDLGFQIVAVSPDDYEMLKSITKKGSISYQIYSDVGAKFIQDMGIGFLTPEKAKGYIFKKTKKQASEILPVPTVMVIDTKGKILFEYINPDYSTRLSSELLLANLRVLKESF